MFSLYGNLNWFCINRLCYWWDAIIFRDKMVHCISIPLFNRMLYKISGENTVQFKIIFAQEFSLIILVIVQCGSIRGLTLNNIFLMWQSDNSELYHLQTKAFKTFYVQWNSESLHTSRRDFNSINLSELFVSLPKSSWLNSWNCSCFIWICTASSNTLHRYSNTACLATGKVCNRYNADFVNAWLLTCLSRLTPCKNNRKSVKTSWKN